MIYQVSVGDRRLRVEVVADGRFLIDDAVVAAEIVETRRGRQWSVRVAGRSHEVTVLTSDPLRLLVDGTETTASALDERAAAASTGVGSARGGRHELRAPMPGLLKTVHVAEGDVVESGAPLMTLEAMKMETTILAEADGNIAEVHVVAGTQVEAGDLLITVA